MLKISDMQCVTANKWAEAFINDDFHMFMKDKFTKIEKKTFEKAKI